MLLRPGGPVYDGGMLQRLVDQNTMHVLVATPGTDQGGIDRVMASLKGQLERDAVARYEVDFVATRGPRHIALSPFYLGAFLARMALLRAAGKLDVVHINLASIGSTYRKLIIARWCRALGVPYVIHLHGADYREYWEQQVSPRLARRSLCEDSRMNDRSAGSELLSMMGLVAAVVAIVILVFFGVGYLFGHLFL